MIRSFLGTLILVNASLAVAFGIFYELALLCVQTQLNAWLALPLTILVCAGGYWKFIRAASRRFP
jgi:hypothetical protein